MMTRFLPIGLLTALLLSFSGVSGGRAALGMAGASGSEGRAALGMAGESESEGRATTDGPAAATGNQAYPDQLEQAERLFQNRAYAKAIPLFEESLAEPMKARFTRKPGSEAAVRERARRERASLRLAECYRLTGRYDLAATWFTRLLVAPDSNGHAFSAYYLPTGQVLQVLGRCDEARPWFTAYSRLHAEDSRGEAGLASCILADTVKQASFDVLNLALNSAEHDFGPLFVDGALWFASGRSTGQVRANGALPAFDPWTGEAYLDLFQSPNWQSEEPDVLPIAGPLNSAFHDGPGQVFAPAGNKTSASGPADADLSLALTRSLTVSRGKGLDRQRRLLLGVFMSHKNGENWTEPEAIDLGLGEALVMHPTWGADGKTLLFSSDAPGGAGGFDLYQTTFHQGGWTQPEWLGPIINSPGDELYPFLDSEENLWFSSDGRAGFGGLDLFIAHRKRKDIGWMEPSLVAPPLNSRYDDFGLIWLKTDTLGVMASNRPGGRGGDDLYEISRNWKAYLDDDLVLLHDSASLVTEAAGGLAQVLGQTVRTTSGESTGGGVARVILPPNNDTVLVMQVDGEGFFSGSVPVGESYLLEVDKTNYLSEPVVLDTRTLKAGESIAVLAEVSEMREDLVVELNNIYYDYGKSHIRPDAEADLERLYKLLVAYPEMRIELSSHTDSRSSAPFNLKLSQQRAEAARTFLTERGIDASRMEAVGYGESRLRNRCTDDVVCAEEDHQFNRRTEFRITYFETVVESKAREFAPGSVPTPEEIVAAREALRKAASEQTSPSNQLDEVPNADRAVGGELATNPWSSGTWYGVQVGIDRTQSADRYNGFAWLGGIRVETSSAGFFRYVIGYLPSRGEAEQVLTVIRDAGIRDAFVVTYQDALRLR
ncbi:MAG: OmpA family protein [Bacteroidetes bacterium]|nr:OmpA family protein [Bacteroidota bacterium]